MGDVVKENWASPSHLLLSLLFTFIIELDEPRLALLTPTALALLRISAACADLIKSAVIGPAATTFDPRLANSKLSLAFSSAVNLTTQLRSTNWKSRHNSNRSLSGDDNVVFLFANTCDHKRGLGAKTLNE